MSEWKLTGQSDEQTYFDLEYYFQKYEKVSGKVDLNN
jgi:dihydrofolate reductase